MANTQSIISMVRDRTDRRYLRLRDDADTHHESAEDWYGSYGDHISTERAGDVTIQAVEYDWLDDEDDDAVAARLRAEDDRLSEDEALALVERARDVREAADSIEGLLDEAVAAYERGHVQGVIEALDEASREEDDHGDDPATRDLAERLLQATGYAVMLCEEGCAQIYIGSADSLDEARDLAERAERGEVGGTPESLWETARASRNPVPGCDYPEPHEDDPEEWVGDYAICRIVGPAND